MAINVDKILADKIFLKKIFDEMKACKYNPLQGWEGSIENPNLELGNNWDLFMDYLPHLLHCREKTHRGGNWRVTTRKRNSLDLVSRNKILIEYLQAGKAKRSSF